MDATIGEIRLVGFTYAPAGWALCNGQLLNISDYDTLYSLLGTTYGGDGQNTFGLPNMCGRLVPGTGAGPGLSNYTQGQMGGVENVTLNTLQLPAHTHPLGPNITASASTQANGQNPPPANAYPAVATSDLYNSAAPNTTLAPGSVTGTAQPAGNNMPHTNLQPTLALNYIIALEGIYPSRP